MAISLYNHQEKTGRPQLLRLHSGGQKISDLSKERRMAAGVTLTKAGALQLAAGLDAGEEQLLEYESGRKTLESRYFSSAQPAKPK